jgi:catechol 2,3-dioxygenase-like lactoylglutathione lyase family enzyme
MLLDHLSIQCADVTAAATFFDALLEPLGAGRVMDLGHVVGFGLPGRPTFWLGPLEHPDRPGPANRPAHIAFIAANRAAVDAFHTAAVDIGAEILHAPKVWPEYHDDYYGAFVRDLDGNNVEAVCHSPIDVLPGD